jgi:hypothetical protein
MNISALLHHELMLVARALVSKNYNEPTFSVKEELAFARADHESRDKDLNQWPHSKVNPFLNRVTRRKEYKRDLSQSSAKEQALHMYISIATLMEYQSLLITVDQECARIFDEWKFKGKASSFKVKRFFKFYAPISKALSKDDKLGKKDAARYSYLRVLDELDQELTFGSAWRPDASYAPKKDHRNPSSTELARRVSARSRVDAFVQDQQDRSLYPAYEVEDGIVKSSYTLLMGE